MFFGGNPFGGKSPFSNGMPGMPGMQGMPGGNADNSEFYETLGVEKNATDTDIKKAYRKLAQKFHPDKPTGNEEKFKKISEAYEVLSDSDNRKKYDQFGKDAVTGNGGAESGADPFEMFSSMFGGGMGRQRSSAPQKRKMKSTMHQMGVSLDDFYKGRTIKIAVTRKRIQVPDGMTKESAVQKCQGCDGQGVRVQIRQVGPGMIQQVQGQCEVCRGGGHIQKPGVTIKQVKKTLEIHVEKGMKNGEQIVFEEEGDENPGIIPGDIVIVLMQKDHDKFKRSGNNLVIKHRVSLVDALCGVNVLVKHMDDRHIHITNEDNQTIIPNSIHVIKGEGMPKRENPNLKGDLYVQFEVKFPKNVSNESKDKLKTIFGSSKFVIPDGECDEYVCEPTRLSEIKESTTNNRSAVDSDDEDEQVPGGMPGMDGQNVQCAQQ